MALCAALPPLPVVPPAAVTPPAAAPAAVPTVGVRPAVLVAKLPRPDRERIVKTGSSRKIKSHKGLSLHPSVICQIEGKTCPAPMP